MSPTLPLLKPCPNKQGNLGFNQETYVLNPDVTLSVVQGPSSETSQLHMEMFIFLGKLMGCAMRNKNYLDLQLAPIIWKCIVREQLTLEDVRDIDVNGANQYVWLKQRKDLNEERFTAGYSDLYFSTTSKGGSNIELHPNGANERVSWGEDIDRYCSELLNFWLNVEFKVVSELVRSGMETQVPSSVLSLLRWNELEELVCGNPSIDVALLHSATEYERGCSASDQHIVWWVTCIVYPRRIIHIVAMFAVSGSGSC
jgi:E3 ubiquitin-protein ligase HERC2